MGEKVIFPAFSKTLKFDSSCYWIDICSQIKLFPIKTTFSNFPLQAKKPVLKQDTIENNDILIIQTLCWPS